MKLIIKNALNKFRSSKVASNAGWIISCKMCKAVLTLISTMIVSRYLGVDRYGLISYAASVVAFVTPIMQLGLSDVLVHEIIISPENEGNTLGTTIILNLCSGVLCIFGICGFVSTVNANEKDTLAVCMCYSLLLFFQAMEMIYYWFQAKLKAKYTSIAILAAYIVVVLVQIVLVFLKANVYLFALSYSIEYLLIAIILFFFYRKEKQHPLHFSLSAVGPLLSQGKYYIISNLMVTIFSQTDKIMLKLMCDDTTVGIYSAAATCASMTSFVFVAIIDSFRPAIFGVKDDAREFDKKMKQLYSTIIWFSLAQCVVFTLAAPIIIGIIYGAEFAQAVSVLRLSVWFTTFSYLGTIRNIWILSYGYQKYLGWINMSGALINIILNALCIPSFGALGAAISSVGAQIFTNVIVGYIIPPLRKNNKLMVSAVNPKWILYMVKGEDENG